MCGVFASLGGWPGQAERAAAALAHRGPDARGVAEIGDVALAHTRLSIIDVGRRSDQPFKYGATTISFNGEIWNYRQVREDLEDLGCAFSTEGDTEVLAAALDRWDEAALPRLQGMFAVAWTRAGDVLKAARDRFGEVPLHVHGGAPFMVSSELRALLEVGADPAAVSWLDPGCVVEAGPAGVATRRWYDAPAADGGAGHEEARASLAAAVRGGVIERAVSDVPVCSLLSGGIDSAVVLRVLAEQVPGVVAYTAVMDPKSPDLACARLVAAACGVELREVAVRAPTRADLASVVDAIEMPHKAQVEIGWACLALADRMRSDGFKVTFSGEGSDELWASYGFAYHALKTEGWFPYRKKLFVGQHRKNFARCNKVFMARSVECRLPFLSTPLVELALSLPEKSVRDGSRTKAVLQDAFASEVPERVVRRQKLAFQDGLGLKREVEALVDDPRAFYSERFRKTFQGIAA